MQQTMPGSSRRMIIGLLPCLLTAKRRSSVKAEVTFFCIAELMIMLSFRHALPSIAYDLYKSPCTDSS